jgi:Domain of unknown function (DUF4280)
MSNVLCHGSLLKCSFGGAPMPFNVLPQNRVLTSKRPAANVMDNKPVVNIPSFGVCFCPANPSVAAATAAAMGVLTPMPCIPATVAPWLPGAPQVLLGGMPVITQQSSLLCSYGGQIQAVVPGQLTVSAK